MSEELRIGRYTFDGIYWWKGCDTGKEQVFNEETLDVLSEAVKEIEFQKEQAVIKYRINFEKGVSEVVDNFMGNIH